MNSPPAVKLLLLGGFILLALSLIAPLIGGRRAWSDGMATKLQQAQANYHAALHSHSHGETGGGDHGKQFAVARREYEQYSSQLEAARTRGSRTAALLRRLGMLACAIGFVSYFLHRFRTERSN